MLNHFLRKAYGRNVKVFLLPDNNDKLIIMPKVYPLLFRNSLSVRKVLVYLHFRCSAAALPNYRPLLQTLEHLYGRT